MIRAIFIGTVRTATTLSLLLAGWAALAFMIEAPFYGTRFRPTLPMQYPYESPKWVTYMWKSDADFLPIRKHIEEGWNLETTPQVAKTWTQRLKGAYNSWFIDSKDHVDLYRVTGYIAVVQKHNPKFFDSNPGKQIATNVAIGWRQVTNPPQSFEFVRRGYLFNAGSYDTPIFDGLAIALLDHEPHNRNVTLAMVREYAWRKPLPSYEERLFAELDYLLATPGRHPEEEAWLAYAYHQYGRKHKLTEYYDKAIALYRTAQAVQGSDRERYERLIQTISAEQRDPNFGMPKGGRYIEDARAEFQNQQARYRSQVRSTISQ